MCIEMQICREIPSCFPTWLNLKLANGICRIGGNGETTTAIKEAKTYTDKVGVSAASDAVRRATRALFNASHKCIRKGKPKVLSSSKIPTVPAFQR